MPGAGNAHEALGRLDKAVQPFAERHWDDSVVLAMHHQNRRRDLARAQIRAELVLQEEPNRHEPKVVCADISGRSEGGLKHDAPDWFFRCNRECQGGAERFARMRPQFALRRGMRERAIFFAPNTLTRSSAASRIATFNRCPYLVRVR